MPASSGATGRLAERIAGDLTEAADYIVTRIAGDEDVIYVTEAGGDERMLVVVVKAPHQGGIPQQGGTCDP